MAEVKISQLTSGTTLDGTELVPIVQGGATVKMTTQDIADLGGGVNPSVIVLNASNGTAVTGTTADTLSQSILIPANTFTSNGMLEVLGRIFKTGTAGGQSFRIYKNTSASLTGATLIATITSGVAALMHQGIRTYRINSNVMSGINTSSALSSDYGSSTQFTTTFDTSVDNYILFSIQLANAADSSVVEMSRTTKYI